MKKLLSIATVAVLGLGSVSTFAFHPGVGDGAWKDWFMMKFEGHGGGQGGHKLLFGGAGGEWPMWPKGWPRAMFGTAVVAALEAKDYSAFVTAWNNSQSNITAPTQADFTKRVEIQKAHDAVESAISNGNYSAFVTALQNLPKFGSADVQKELSVPTQDEFNEMIAKKKNHESMQAAVKSNDYNAYLAARNASKPTVPTQDQFTLMVEKFNQKTQDWAKRVVKKMKRVLKMNK